MGWPVILTWILYIFESYLCKKFKKIPKVPAVLIIIVRNLIMELFFQVSDALRNDYITYDFLGGMGLKNCAEISDWNLENSANLTAQQNTTMEICNSTRDFYSMQYSLIINILFVFLGGICFFISAIYIVKDKERVERFVAGNIFI